jgi:ABC-2 type transport system permease protein
MSDAALAVRPAGYENRAFWRNPAAAFFTFVFPLLFMVIFNVLFGAEAAIFFTPAIIVFGVVTATYTNLAMTVTIARDEGVLKRIRGTPLPAWAYLAGKIGHAVGIAFLLVVIVAAFGALVYDVEFPWGALPALVVVLVVAVIAFSALGLAVSGLIPNADAAPAIVNGVLFPILFVSGVFFPIEGDAFLGQVGDVFPVRHFVNAVFAAFDPRIAHGMAHGWAWGDLAVVAIWGVVGAVVAVRFFRWDPRRK